jgi:hypothetical protein
VSSIPSDSALPLGYVECRGALVRAQMRSVAVVLAITGRLTSANVDTLAAHVTRFTALGDPVVLDVNALEIEDDASLLRLVSIVDAECHLHAAAWLLVATAAVRDLLETTNDAVVDADSVPMALRYFADAIYHRRNLRLAM